MKKYCFGIDIGGTTVKCGLFNVDGEVLDGKLRQEPKTTAKISSQTSQRR